MKAESLQLLGWAITAIEQLRRTCARLSAAQTQQPQQQAHRAVSRTPVASVVPNKNSVVIKGYFFVPCAEKSCPNGSVWHQKLPHFWNVSMITHLGLEAARSRIKSLMCEGKERTIMLMDVIYHVHTTCDTVIYIIRTTYLGFVLFLAYTVVPPYPEEIRSKTPADAWTHR